MKSTFFMYKVLIICFLVSFTAVAVKHSKGALVKPSHCFFCCRHLGRVLSQEKIQSPYQKNRETL